MRGVFEFPEALRPVQRVIDDALERVEALFVTQLASDLPAIDALTRHVERYRGKMLRPSVAVLCGLAADPDADEPFASGEPVRASDELVKVGAVCEMIHMATLVHDDVLDEAAVRRRGQTVNHLHGNEMAVMLGDYLIAASYELCSQLQDQRTALTIGRISMDLCAGELLQLHNRDSYSLGEATYYEIVARKTGALIAAACELGARYAPRQPEPGVPERFGAFGSNLGVAFQIQDDLLDLLGEERTVGKSVNKDLEKGKMTLPMIHHLARVDAMGRGAALELLEASGVGGEEASSARVALAAALQATGSIEFAEREARRLIEEAKDGLEPIADTLPKLVLLIMADAVVSRSF